MQCANLLDKAEGVKIRDDEHLLQEAPKRKKRGAQRQRAWENRTARVADKTQLQDPWRQNSRENKEAEAERRLEKTRKRGRILPQDLEPAGLA